VRGAVGCADRGRGPRRRSAARCDLS
jgi:hypothetical protein